MDKEKRIISILETLDLETGKRRVLNEFDYLIEAPNWLKDGDTLLFNANGRICRYSISGQKTEVLDSGSCDRCNNDHVPSADNRWLAVSNNESGRGSHIYILPIEGGLPRCVTQNSPSYLHGWSNDGLELAYCAFREGKIDIYSIPAAGGTEKKLTDGIGYNDGPEYSPDDRHI